MLLACLFGLGLGGRGCSQRNDFSVDPARVTNTWLGPLTIAVAPALNFSGSTAFDPNKVADLMASELGYADRVTVIPVSRVLAVMDRLGLDYVGSPDQALAIKDQIGADTILVFAVTEYDPYDPPTLGIVTQLYGRPPSFAENVGLDPILVSRQARPFAVSPISSGPDVPVAQTQQTFNAAHEFTIHHIRRFASRRGYNKSPYGWRVYMVSQEHFIRFCSAMVVRQLFTNPAGRMPPATGQREVAS